MNKDAVIDIRGMTVQYGDLTAVKDLDMQVFSGQVYGLIGPNGAGKTTTIRVLATLQVPQRGSVKISGVDALQSPAAVRPLIGYMPDFFGVYDSLKVSEYLDFFGRTYAIDEVELKDRIGDLLSLTNLEAKRDSYVEGLSRGMKQRLCLARALLHDPPVLLLDEPASGLDPKARIEMRELIKQLRQKGKTILVSSHILTELADICTHVGMIELGQMVVSGAVEALLAEQHRRRVLSLRVRNVGLAIQSIESMQDAQVLSSSEDVVRASIEDDDAVAEALITTMVQAGVGLLSASEVKDTLESLFLARTKGQVC
ncbi:MAG: ABC transporter ATP-binding protein [Acidobacteriota bacterium]